ncbi:MAG: hypothetical protein JJW00_08980 [Sulfurimonas sp.]|nr:hypothetical protein [Sulfurimonas sp.]
MTELERIEQLEKEIRKLKGLNENSIPSYSYSDIKLKDLEKLLTIERDIIDKESLNRWLDNDSILNDTTISFLKHLIERNIELINNYDEEDLKINFIAPLITEVDYFMLKDDIRSFYHEPLRYETEKFIFKGRADMMVSKGLFTAKKPYFFLQEFKKGFVSTNPEPQLLAELISAVELNDEISMKGCYVIGSRWNFVILEKISVGHYKYFVSRDFNCVNLEDLKEIYKNLMFIKNEIIKSVKKEKNNSL